MGESAAPLDEVDDRLCPDEITKEEAFAFHQKPSDNFTDVSPYSALEFARQFASHQ